MDGRMGRNARGLDRRRRLADRRLTRRKGRTEMDKATKSSNSFGSRQKERFGDKADIYGRGIPVPDRPLFTKDGFRVYWGDYAIDTPHAYEEGGKFPSLFIYWHSVDGVHDASRGDLAPGDQEASVNWLTHDAKVDFGIVKPLADEEPK